MVNASVSSRASRPLALIVAALLATLLALSVAGCGTETATDETTPDTPTSGDGAVADGAHFGWVVEIGEDHMLVDLAEFFGNEEAQEAALADGAIDSLDDLPNPFYIRNPDETPVRLEIAPDAEFTIIVDPSAGTDKTLTPEELASLAAGESDGNRYYAGLPGQPGPGGLPMELTIADGKVAGGEQVYIP